MTEFTCRSGGSNLYAGTLDGTNEASTTPLVTYASGTYDATTRVFTPASGNPVTDGVIAGTHWVSVSDGLASLRCTGVANSRATAPDAAPLDIAGDLDIRCRVKMDDWTPATTGILVSKMGTAGQQSYEFSVDPSGRMAMRTTPDGSTNITSVGTTLGLADGSTKWLRATVDVDNGAGGNDVKFYTSDDGSSWTQVGSTITNAGTTSIFNSNAALSVGIRSDNSTQPLTGNVYSVEVRDGIGGTIVANPDFSAQSPGTTSFSDTAGSPNTWSVGSAASIVAATSAQLTALVSARDATTITLDATRRSGGTTTGTATLIVGGAWRGPNGTDPFPLNHVAAATVAPRINLKNDQTYSITAGIVVPQAGPGIIQGYTSTFGDAGRFTLDGGNPATSFTMLTANGANWQLWDFVVQNNGVASGNGAGIGGGFIVIARGKVSGIRRAGISTGNASYYYRDVEITGTNPGAGGQAGIVCSGNLVGERLYIHDNGPGVDTHGVSLSGTSDWAAFFDCIIESNGNAGVRLSGNGGAVYLHNCDFYANGGDGVEVSGTSGTSRLVAENCNFVLNGGYGVDASGAGQRTGRVINCGFGSGAVANTSGTVNSPKGIDEISNVTYPSGQTPWADPASGDFRIVLAEAKDDGRGTLPTAGTTTSAPAIGAAQPTSVATAGRRRWGMFGLGLGPGVRVD